MTPLSASPGAWDDKRMTTRRLMLLDSASLYFRAFYGVPERFTAEGVPNNAVRGFVDMVASLISTYSPTDIVACWDNDWRPAFRVEAISSYKAHRVLEGSDGAEESPANLTPQVPVIADLLAACGIARVGVDGYEADDVIGTYCHRFMTQGPVDVVTGDRDLFQLVNDEMSVRVIYTAKGGVRSPDLVNESYLVAKYGVSSGRAYADMAVLRGDTSDGLPGVSGIGEKTAAALITEFGSLAGVRDALDANDPRLKGARRLRLEAAGDYLDVAPRVVDVALDVPIPGELAIEVPTRLADPDAFAHLAEKFELGGSADRLQTALTGR